MGVTADSSQSSSCTINNSHSYNVRQQARLSLHVRQLRAVVRLVDGRHNYEFKLLIIISCKVVTNDQLVGLVAGSPFNSQSPLCNVSESRQL